MTLPHISLTALGCCSAMLQLNDTALFTLRTSLGHMYDMDFPSESRDYQFTASPSVTAAAPV